MLKLHITAETWDENYNNGPGQPKGRFGTVDYGTLQLEHSLISISKWEEKYHRSFLDSNDKTAAEMLYYIMCMTVNQNVKMEAYGHITEEQMNEILDYIQDPHSATTFGGSSNTKSTGKKQIITSELIYYWMFANQIDKDCEKWPIQRLLNLIRIFSIKNTPPDKKSRAEQIHDRQQAYAERAALNAKRKAAAHTTG